MKTKTQNAKPAEIELPGAKSPAAGRHAARSDPQETGTIEQSLLVNASPLEVFRTLAEPLRHGAFTGTRATGVARPGGRFTAFNGYIEGVYLAVVPGKRLVMRWRTRAFPKGAKPSRLELVLKAEGGGTRLTMVQCYVPASQVEKYRSGWIANYWDPLRDWFDAR